jgi:hypothetical protein
MLIMSQIIFDRYVISVPFVALLASKRFSLPRVVEPALFESVEVAVAVLQNTLRPNPKITTMEPSFLLRILNRSSAFFCSLCFCAQAPATSLQHIRLDPKRTCAVGSSLDGLFDKKPPWRDGGFFVGSVPQAKSELVRPNAPNRSVLDARKLKAEDARDVITAQGRNHRLRRVTSDGGSKTRK